MEGRVKGPIWLQVTIGYKQATVATHPQDTGFTQCVNTRKWESW